MLTTLGISALLVALLASVYGCVAALLGGIRHDPRWIESGRIALLLTFPLVTLSTLSMLLLLLIGAYEVSYVFSVTNSTTPFMLRMSALWGGQEGSLLFWSWLLSLFAAFIALRNWDQQRPLLPWVSLVFLVVQSFFLLLANFFENPFKRFWMIGDHSLVLSVLKPINSILIAPPEGQGLPALLNHSGMIFHPPALYLGFIAFIIPFAFAIAALITRKHYDDWIPVTRGWILLGWAFLSIGLILGSRWAYDVLGWGGYWGWDPVEVAALLPWLSGTAFLHSIIAQEKSGLFRRWNVFLIMLTFILVILGTFLTRSGMLTSVHAFAHSSMGNFFFVFLALLILASMGLMLWRWYDLKSEHEVSSWFSREALFFINTLLFLGIVIICLWGILSPVVTEFLGGDTITLGPEYYKRAAGPLFGVLVILMGITPLTLWGHSNLRSLGKLSLIPFVLSLAITLGSFLSGIQQIAALISIWLISFSALLVLAEFIRSVWIFRRQESMGLSTALWQFIATKHRRFGGILVHFGIILMALGIIGIELFQVQKQVTLAINQQFSIEEYTLSFRALDAEITPANTQLASAVLEVETAGRSITPLIPRMETYLQSEETVTLPAMRSTLAGDLYVVLMEWHSGADASITLKAYYNPLVNWLWIGGVLLVLGTLAAGWPDRKKSGCSISNGV